MTERLHIFAVNAALDICHTHYSRAQGGPSPDLPPLADWLGTAVDTDEIELFTLTDIGDLLLSDYVDLAFAPEKLGRDDAARMNALEGSVLLVPERALSGDPAPGPQLTLIASVPLATADHRARLPKADVAPAQAASPQTTRPAPRRRSLPWLMLILALIALIALWVM
jgi:hypothetical protein